VNVTTKLVNIYYPPNDEDLIMPTFDNVDEKYDYIDYNAIGPFPLYFWIDPFTCDQITLSLQLDDLEPFPLNCQYFEYGEANHYLIP
jgi:hypothetical protein